MDKELQLSAFAKVNLTLDVLGKRADGYHEVTMIMQAIDLADQLSLREQAGEITVQCDALGLACDQSNLAYRAAALLKDVLQIKQGVHIAITKKIPLAAGLAGGSADAAGVLIGLNKLWRLGLTLEQLSDLGAQLGSDVPFCLRGGTMLATGRGEILKPVAALPSCYLILAKPPISVSTAWVYQNYRQHEAVIHPDTGGMLQCLQDGNLSGVAGKLGNVLETVTIAAHPEVGRLKKLMEQYGVLASLMSGSGPTVFGLVPGREQAREIAARLSAMNTARIIVAKALTERK